MKLGRAEIEALIPHAGRMCLLDAVLDWNAQRIVCIANPHRDPPHPLACAGRLTPLSLIEYAAQASAIHAGLNAAARAARRQARLASVSAVRFERLEVLDSVEHLEIHVEKLAGTGDGARYRFQILAAAGLSADGLLTVSG